MAKKSINEYKNELTYVNVLNELKNLASDLFEWGGLPDSVDIEYMERYLIHDGKVVFFEDKLQGFYALQCNNVANGNVYGKPINFVASGYGYSKRLTKDECVIIFNTPLGTPSITQLEEFARDITDVKRTIDTNLIAHKTPFMVAVDEKLKLSTQIAFEKVEKNENFILIDNTKGLNINDNFKVLILEAPYIIDKLSDYKNTIKSEAYTYLGIDNVNIDKKERTLVDEINGNNDIISRHIELMFTARKEACKKINKMFPSLKVTVKRKHQPKEQVQEQEEDVEDEQETLE